LVLFPGIDLAVSGLFYTPGVGFGARGTWFERLVHESTYWLLILGVPALIAVWWGQGRVGRPSKGDCPNLRSSPSELHPVQDSNLDTGIVPGTGIDIGPGTGTDTGIGPGTGNCRGPRPDGHILGGRDLAYLLLVLALGPGLIVNGLLKEHWGRARPVNCVEFGGSQTFTPAFVFSDQGGKSFSSGHAAGSAYWVVVALVLARGLRRRYWLGLAVGYSLLVAWARLAAGGHFFSDILISWLILALLARGLHGRFYPHPVTKPPVAAS
jgi:membrane-associated PAP2 superfamily phosphatase